MRIIKILAIAFLFLIAGAVYVYYQTGPLSLYSFKTSRLLSKVSPELSFYTLTNAANIIGNRNYENFPKVVDKESLLVVLPVDKAFRQKVADYVGSLPGNSFDPKGKYDLGRLFYELGVFSFYNGHPELTSQLFKVAVGFNPNLGFWQVELANYYFQNHQSDLAKSVLDRCMGVPASVDSCKNYLDNNFLVSTSESVGFLQDSVRTYFDSGRR